MAITKRQAKIYAIRYLTSSIEDSLMNLEKSNPTDLGFSSYERNKIIKELESMIESNYNRLINLGDNPHIEEWNSPHVRENY